MIQVKIVEDSISMHDMRLTTFVLTYPRFIHSEFLTHRMFSRNASSSRAIPVKKQIQMVIDNPAIPIAFTRNQKGMQGGEALSDKEHDSAVTLWFKGRDEAVKIAGALSDLEVHKQYANRVLEPWSHISVVCSATEFANFFALRMHPAAQPEIQELATKMYELYKSNIPDLKTFNWHLPFVTPQERMEIPEEQQIKISVARCARVSYLNHDGTKSTLEQDLKLYDRLLGSVPIHASPAEHQAFPSTDPSHFYGNFRGWHQYRKRLANENVVDYVRS